MRNIADDIETGLEMLAVGVFVATENALAEQRLRGAILQHNARVAAVRAQRARNRAAQAELGNHLMAGWLADREQLH